ncbi:hypothetical protein PN483_10535 [Nodularia spumigena CS-591/04]|uniref:hypothetical protein n=1 Tax=Nodularia spumigena TaxID=70799 RepID=UPI00232C3FE5|nr:hypothetical protein [Nodularia spumigena]MDB9322364.1 hypothetical protein [Nodularia spumigena CS-591/07A]MDB9330924.1 hypothetical protein [Nodularia spumigena CS-591/04]MDB9360229.1 hypothetical protein [Nodularia spumigena CS-588/02]MDB9366171.1 hypothetical protein [Nodularia spumigena CS-588/02A10]
METSIEATLIETNCTAVISGEILRAILTDPPRKSPAISAELLFLDGIYILHHRYQENPDAHVYKFISPAALRTAFSHEPIDTGWMEPGIVRWGTGSTDTYLVKFIPPAIYTINCEQLGDLTVTLPAMVFAGKKFKYWVWAIKDKEFTPQAPAFHVPLPNIYSSGQVCWGVNEPPAANSVSINQAWKLFISSVFTNHFTINKSHKYRKDVRQQLLKLHKRYRRSTYPVSDLMPIGNQKSVAMLVQEILNEPIV